jgi:hypothetical protein
LERACKLSGQHRTGVSHAARQRSRTTSPRDSRRPAGDGGPPRRLALASFDDLTFSRLIEFAKELEDRAATLEPGIQTFSHEDAVAVQQVENNDD